MQLQALGHAGPQILTLQKILKILDCTAHLETMAAVLGAPLHVVALTGLSAISHILF